MSNAFRITRLSMVLTLTAGLAACNDLEPPPPKAAPIAAEPPRPSELPPLPAVTTTPPTPTPTPTTGDQLKPQATVAKGDDDDDDQEIEPSEALAGARKLLADGEVEKALRAREARRAADAQALRPPGTCSAAPSCASASARTPSRRSRRRSSSTRRARTHATTSGSRSSTTSSTRRPSTRSRRRSSSSPSTPYMWNNLGMAYEQLDRLDDARDAYDKAVAMDSDRARDQLERGSRGSRPSFGPRRPMPRCRWGRRLWRARTASAARPRRSERVSHRPFRDEEKPRHRLNGRRGETAPAVRP